MRLYLCALFAAGLLTAVLSAQPPADKPAAPAGLVERMMALDKNRDGQLTRDEMPDARSQRTFDRADANKDGVVTLQELKALAAQEEAIGGSGRGGPGFSGRGEGGRDGGRGGRGGFGGPGGPGFGRFTPGQVLPPFLVESLRLTDDQRKQIEQLQKDVDARLGQILTDDQKAQLRQVGERTGGRGGRGSGRGERP